MTLAQDYKRGRDPSVKMLRSGFGRQVRSASSTQPSWGFGTSGRDNALKQYISPEHAKVMSGNNSQGPVYKVYSSIGAQPDSTMETPGSLTFGTSARLPKAEKAAVPGPGAYKVPEGLGQQKVSQRNTSPRAVFGTATRDSQQKVFLDDELMKTYYGQWSPGPTAYNAPDSMGSQVDSKKESSPSFKQGNANRFKYDFLTRARDMPGAGQYNINGAVGKQTLSNKKTLPTAKFGTSTRDAAKKTFISKEHEKQAYGEVSPGPVTAAQASSIGNQTLSMRSTSPGWGFGTSRRIKDYITEAPGPGTYYA